jgi:two-component system, LytTR family, sensor kinase
MRHPFSGNHLFSYVLLCLIGAGVHGSLLFLLFGFPAAVAWADGAFLMGSLGLFGYSSWFVLRTMPPLTVFSMKEVAARLGLVVMLGAAAAYFGKISWHPGWVQEKIGTDPLAELQPLRFVWAMLWSGILVITYSLIQQAVVFRQQEDTSVRLKAMLQEAELEMLKFQINPHFIFNSLNSISSLTLTHAEGARDMVIKLSEFLRATLRPERSALHSLEEELHHMDLYLEIERVRFGHRLEVERIVDAGCMHMKLPAMVLQPLYENAVKYGVYGQLGEVKIITEVQCHEQEVSISISNTFDAKAILPKGKGIGLDNVRKRMALTYGQAQFLEIEQGTHTFKVTLHVPINEPIASSSHD